MKFDAQTALIAYAGITTAALSLFLLAAAAPAAKTMDVIEAQRINIREPDGTLRFVLSNAASAPGYFVKGREYPHPGRRTAGMLFLNDEGTENGGLIFGGAMVNGRATSSGSLSFDRYGQDQIVQLVGEQHGDRLRAGIGVNDRPEQPFDLEAVKRAASLPEPARSAAYAAAGAVVRPRAFVGRDTDDSSQVVLRDGSGRKRLVMRVTADGKASIDFLDERGAVVRSVSPNG